MADSFRLLRTRAPVRSSPSTQIGPEHLSQVRPSLRRGHFSKVTTVGGRHWLFEFSLRDLPEWRQGVHRLLPCIDNHYSRGPYLLQIQRYDLRFGVEGFSSLTETLHENVKRQNTGFKTTPRSRTCTVQIAGKIVITRKSRHLPHFG
jgi:hypothetical protein